MPKFIAETRILKNCVANIINDFPHVDLFLNVAQYHLATSKIRTQVFVFKENGYNYSIIFERQMYRHNGKWYKVCVKPYEPERQTAEVAWAQIREPLLTTQEVYRRFFEKQREDARILYPSFRKDAN